MLLAHPDAPAFFPPLARYMAQRGQELHLIPQSRQQVLKAAAEQLCMPALAAGNTPAWVFVCTHNARRSQFAQIWAQVASWYCSYLGLRVYSAGTEATKVHPSVISTLLATGMQLIDPSLGDNPRHSLLVSNALPAQVLYSKTLDALADDAGQLAAIMVCSEADAACPHVPGALVRVSLPYADPRWADGSAEQAQAYADCSATIAREMLYLFSILVHKS